MDDLLESCPWCKGSLELGMLQGDRMGLVWHEKGASAFKRAWFFTGESLGKVFIAQRCRNCEKVILIKKR